MSLIICPECGKQISSFAESCPHCGYPIKSHTQNLKYDLILLSDVSNPQIMKIIRSNRTLFLGDAMKLLDNLPSIVFCELDISKAIEIKSLLESNGAKVDMIESDKTIHNNYFEIPYDSNKIECPRCHSGAVTTGNRGFSLVWGFIGSGKTVNHCAKCGYKWEPKR